MIITDLWRYPVKSLQGERVDEVRLGPDGMNGDRAWSLVDEQTGVNLTARREPRLLTARATLVDGERPTITLADGSVAATDDELSAWLGRPVALTAAEPDQAGTYETQADETETGQWYQWQGPAGSFHDSTRSKVSMVSEATLGAWDRRRFRINIVVDHEQPGAEDDLVGHRLAVGDAIVTVTKQIDRCVMVTRPQTPTDEHGAIERDLSVLRDVNREREGMLGIGAMIEQPGRIRVGDRVDDLGPA